MTAALPRRSIFGAASALLVLASKAAAADTTETGLYGMFGGLKAQPGKRTALADILLADTGAGMPGCLQYLVSEDLADPDLLWISEIWETKAAHDASLRLPAVQTAIARGRPLIAGFQKGAETRLLGGIGAPKR